MSAEFDAKRRVYLRQWQDREAAAEAMQPLIGRLYRERGVITLLYGSSLVQLPTVDLLKTHRFVRQILDFELSPTETLPVLEAVAALDLAPAKVDLGKLLIAWRVEGLDTDLSDFVARCLARVCTGRRAVLERPRDVVLYGFGRIGRLLARILVDRVGGGDKLQLRGIVVRPQGDDDLRKRASLLRRDSVHGPFRGIIRIDEEAEALIVNGNLISLIRAETPEAVDYGARGIERAIVIDNTGRWRDREGLGRHLAARGVGEVVLTAPGKDDIPNIVYGVNDDQMEGDERIWSAASCTTNAIAPILKAVNERFGIERGHIETCHSYTNDQNLLDNIHKKARRGRAAPLNMVLSETGAASAVAKAIPELEGRLTANAIRVPTPNVSLAVLQLDLGRSTTVDRLNDELRDVSLHSTLQQQVDFISSPEVVSSDFVGSPLAGIVDAGSTIVDGRHCVLYVWYDNEYGYSQQVVRIVQRLAGIDVPVVPP